MGDVTCSEPGCDRPIVARGLCGRDYQRWRTRQGSDWTPPPRAKTICAVDDCPREADARGFCNRHYENLRKYGNPVPQKDRPLEDRLREVGWTVTESNCWEWKGKRNDNNYGLFTATRHGYKNARAHRATYECFVESLPDDVLLRHTCDNPPCVNPDHLIPGTHLDNSRDMVERRRHWAHDRTECRKGHDLTQPGAVKVIARPGGRTENNCAECERDRKARYEQRKRDAQEAA